MYEEIFLFTSNPILDYGILFMIGIIIIWWSGKWNIIKNIVNG